MMETRTGFGPYSRVTELSGEANYPRARDRSALPDVIAVFPCML
jgi:hypothetical protein